MDAKIEIKHDQLFVCGELGFTNVKQLRKFGNECIAKYEKPVFDLSKVTAHNNASLALLIAWTRYAKLNNKMIKFIHVPVQLIDNAKLSGVDKILPIHK